jgi:hypothetical protein
MEMKETSLTETMRTTCPAHHISPVVNTNSDQITIRCCCDFFTRKYISAIGDKLSENSLNELIDTWEKDLVQNELQHE